MFIQLELGCLGSASNSLIYKKKKKTSLLVVLDRYRFEVFCV